MKVTNSSGVTRYSPTGSVRRTGSSEGVSSASSVRRVEDSVQILGVSPEEISPRVHQAILSLMQEVESLRRELEESNRRLREMEDLADLDALLPIPNRRAFVRELNRMIGFAQRYGTPSTLIFIDLNDMKLINDEYGHEGGDKALLHLARLLIDNVRGTDVVARLGGDEFGVILAQADEATGQEKAKTLADVIANSPIELGGKPYHLKMAYGTYTIKQDDEPHEALDKADKAMYEKKREMKGEDNVR
ncbi:GGDEF domain-containing protein [Gimibacter soli]|uniref:diguanylate cyclase n=1 Tax=Gimibacter soli TaxID=3024400 RepID=A0AAF0BGV4_9PROT|nr:GGDEF domain-containing protein [Gimibacter soli]WCL53908.1 GGDEF domain-containing protein [Gimibacter soli]